MKKAYLLHVYIIMCKLEYIVIYKGHLNVLTFIKFIIGAVITFFLEARQFVCGNAIIG